MKRFSFACKLALLALMLPLAALAADEAKPASKPKDILENMRFRNLGPAVLHDSRGVANSVAASTGPW